MNKYTVVDTGIGSLRYNVLDGKGIVVAVFVSEVRANNCAKVMTVMKDMYNDRD